MSAELSEFAMKVQLADDAEAVVDAFKDFVLGVGFLGFSFGLVYPDGQHMQQTVLAQRYTTSIEPPDYLERLSNETVIVDHLQRNMIFRTFTPSYSDAAHQVVVVPIRDGFANFAIFLITDESGELDLGRLASLQAASSLFHQFYADLLRDVFRNNFVTNIQRHYLSQLAEGRTLSEVAEINGVTEQSIQQGLKKVYIKMGVANLREALALCLALGTVTPRSFMKYSPFEKYGVRKPSKLEVGTDD